MLTALQTYIAAHGTVSMADLSLHFHTSSQALRPMLAKLMRKGRIRSLPRPTQCTDCTCCDLNSVECYEWAIAAPDGKAELTTALPHPSICRCP
ncbi:FeoC-like transcriptional regulator [Nodosilinea sp. PGN35]|uniref:FeoC-like transcriptional regulator n=1 Tax=Nodosilinea sp. PGN35 TaxID=3020489 RepID=UPI0023B333C1|nr:FeoC-like transcriptional regulator [Nodosilinea sp. TSF1-S3]MDF0367082.1 FeoC-like transcriptional regulator [Nodosilinea sp. TSF1-S3]